jgi:hypothetical protein
MSARSWKRAYRQAKQIATKKRVVLYLSRKCPRWRKTLAQAGWHGPADRWVRRRFAAERKKAIKEVAHKYTMRPVKK